MKGPNCYTCKYRGRGRVPGKALSCCNYPGNKTGIFTAFDKANAKNMSKLRIKADRVGIQNGWFFWPINFDPVWLIHCNGYEENKKEEEK